MDGLSFLFLKLTPVSKLILKKDQPQLLRCPTKKMCCENYPPNGNSFNPQNLWMNVSDQQTNRTFNGKTRTGPFSLHFCGPLEVQNPEFQNPWRIWFFLLFFFSDQWFFVILFFVCDKKSRGGHMKSFKPLPRFAGSISIPLFGLKFPKNILFCRLCSPRKLIDMRHLTSFFPLSLTLTGQKSSSNAGGWYRLGFKVSKGNRRFHHLPERLFCEKRPDKNS